LLSAILTERYSGDVAHIADLPAPTMNEPRYERVHRVLRRYDEHLTDAEREFLKLFSAFRTPVNESAFDKVFVPLLKNITTEDTENTEKNKKKNSVPPVLSVVKSLVSRLVTYRILRFDAHDRTYTTHPLIRNHYLALLTKGDTAQEKAAHEQIKDYYLSIGGDTPQYPTLDDLKPFIEVVHHACEAGAYDEARDIYWHRISQAERRVVVHQLSAFETELALVSEFFSSRDNSREPRGSNKQFVQFLVNEVGLCLMNLGRLGEAAPFFERYVKENIEAQDWFNANRGCINLAELHASLGALEASTQAARQAVDFAQRVENKQATRQSMCHQGLAEHLLGHLELATAVFAEAETIDHEFYPDNSYLFSNRGIFHADHLRRAGNADYARRITKANIEILERHRTAPHQVSQCHRVLGDLDADAVQHDSARTHYDTALKIARSISYRPALIEALLARGRWAAKYMKDATSAFNDLNEALGYAVEGGYRIYEADIRVALAWANAVDSQQSTVDSKQKARAEAERALKMSEEMGYYWGKVDAEEVLKEIRGQGTEVSKLTPDL
jgi:tetratricopeptide (TPR) repeat protein